MGGFDLFVTGCSHLLLSEPLLSFKNVMITLTSARWSARLFNSPQVSETATQIETIQWSSLTTNGSLMKVEKCSLGAFYNTFDLH